MTAGGAFQVQRRELLALSGGVEYGLLEAVGPEARWPRNREGPESPKNITELEGVEDH